MAKQTLHDKLLDYVEASDGLVNAHVAAAVLDVSVVILCGTGKAQKALKAHGLCLRYRVVKGEGLYLIEKEAK